MQFLKKNSAIWLSAFIAAFIAFSALYTGSLYPFGNRTLAWGDLLQQNLPVLMEFKDVLSGNSGAFFTMGNAGGMDFLSIFLFLASSPFSLLAAFVKKADLVYFINIIIVLKIIACSITSSVFFKHFFKSLNTCQITALSIGYAFCGYSMMYYQLVTWLDVMYMFPLFLIAFHKLLTQNKIVGYVVTLSLMIVFQFYLGYMLALFIIFGFALYILYADDKKQIKKTIAIFLISTAIALLITSAVCVPAFLQFMTSARGGSVRGSLASSSLFTVSTTTLPMILSTAFVLFGIIGFPLFKLLDEKKNRPLYYMLFLMVIPVFIEPVNKMWHTGSYQAFPVRYGYILVLLGLCCFALILEKCNQSADKLHNEKFNNTAAIFSVALVFIYVMITKAILRNSDAVDNYVRTLWCDEKQILSIAITGFLGCGLIFALLKLYKKGYLRKEALSLLVLVFVFYEGVFSSEIFISLAQKSSDEVISAIDLSNRIDDESEYRVKVHEKYFAVNFVGAMGYNSLSHYTSLNKESYMFAMKKLGFSSYWMEVNSNGSTAFTDAVLGNKYTIARSFSSFYGSEKVFQNNLFAIFKNQNYLSLGNVISKSQVKALEVIPESDRIDFQQDLFSVLTASEQNLISRYDFTSSEGVLLYEENGEQFYRKIGDNSVIKYDLIISERQRLYFDCFRDISTKLTEPINGSFAVYVNGNKIEDSYPSKRNNGMLYLGEFENAHVTVKLEVLKSSSAYSFGVFGVDMKSLSDGISKVSPAQLTIDGDVITALADSDSEDNYLMLTIPMNNGFKITVNGKEVSAEKILDTFMAIPLEKGSNVIRLSYSPYGLKPSLFLFAAGMILLIFTARHLKKGNYRLIKAIENTAYYAFFVFAGAVFILIYIYPMTVYLREIIRRK